MRPCNMPLTVMSRGGQVEVDGLRGLGEVALVHERLERLERRQRQRLPL